MTIPDSTIEHMIQCMKLENSSDFLVADHAQLDWCPCCGLNIRFFKDGKFVAKLITQPPVARKLACGILTLAREMSAEASSEAKKKKLVDRIQARIWHLAQSLPNAGKA